MNSSPTETCQPLREAETQIPESLLSQYLEVWKKTIDLQMHFNDLELRIRNFAITVLAALLTGAGLTLKENIAVSLFGYYIPVAALLLLTALVTWLAFYSMDAAWYHRLLLGAVTHGEKIENELGGTLKIIHLTHTIGIESPDGAGLSKLGSKRRMNAFYLIVAASLLMLSLLLILGKATKASDASTSSPVNTINPAKQTGLSGPSSTTNADPSNNNSRRKDEEQNANGLKNSAKPSESNSNKP
jgi:hypothetical protein